MPPILTDTIDSMNKAKQQPAPMSISDSDIFFTVCLFKDNCNQPIKFVCFFIHMSTTTMAPLFFLLYLLSWFSTNTVYR